MPTTLVDAEPEAIEIDPARTAVVVIDMQRDFLEPGGFGETLGNDVSLLQLGHRAVQGAARRARGAAACWSSTRVKAIGPICRDAPKAKVERGAPSMRIGAPGPMGRILIRGEAGHDIVPELYPHPGEPVIDKPGKGAFWATDLHSILVNRGIENLIVCGVTTEVCVHTTVREANDRGYRCIVPGDCCGSYFPEFHAVGLRMIKAQGGIFGWVTRLGPRAGGAAVTRTGLAQPKGAHRRETAMTATTKPKLFTAGDWNAFFGFGTNILVNLLVLTALLRYVLKMPDDIVFGRILPAAGLMLFLSTMYYAWLAYKLAQADRARRRCALPSGISVPHMFIVVFVIMLPISARAPATRSRAGRRG